MTARSARRPPQYATASSAPGATWTCVLHSALLLENVLVSLYG